MVPLPLALGLSLCDRVIIEEGTKNPSLINIFLAIPVTQFPSDPMRFSVFAALTDGVGDGAIELVAVRLATEEQVYSQRGQIRFPDRLTIVNTHFRVSRIRFPASGLYAFLLLLDGELVSERRFKVYLSEVLG